MSENGRKANVVPPRNMPLPPVPLDHADALDVRAAAPEHEPRVRVRHTR